MDGILVIDKPAGPTSHDVVSEIKRLLGAKKVGHLGTLDPAASGVLPLVINGATRLASELSGGDKLYTFDLVLGAATDTDDDQGEILREANIPTDVLDRLLNILPVFTGEICQVPPVYSAVKVDGEPLYKRAREGRPILGDPRMVSIHELQPIYVEPEEELMRIHMQMRSSPGTYVRALCRDIGEALGCYGHAAGIRRLKSGPYRIEDSVELEDFRLMSPERRFEKIEPLHLQ